MAELLGVRYVDLGDLISSANVITLHAPLTRKRITAGSQSLRAIRPGSMVVNTARGGVIHSDALIEALDQGIILGAGVYGRDESVMQKEARRLIALTRSLTTCRALTRRRRVA